MYHNNLYSLSRVKVNLYLHLINRRKDGNHNLDSLVAFPEIGDEIIISPSSSSIDKSLSNNGKFIASLEVGIITEILGN